MTLMLVFPSYTLTAYHVTCILAIAVYLKHNAECAPTLNKEMPTPCDTDEFFDSVVDRCQRCADVCRPNMMPMEFCRNNCPDFYDRVMGNSFTSRTTSVRRVTTPAFISPASDIDGFDDDQLPAEQPVQNMDEEYNVQIQSSVSSELLRNPLVWVSVIALTISVAATTAIVVVVICRRRKTGSGDKTSATTSTSSSVSNSAEDKQLLDNSFLSTKKCEDHVRC